MDIENRAFTKAAWRLLPFMGLLYFICFLDRVNVGFAALTMNQDLGFSAQVFGFGAGVFFIAYALLEVPSNVILARVGARLWIFRIMLTWGVLSAATAFVYDGKSFYVLRFLLGAAEAGFFPGMIFYLGLWFPASRRAGMVAGFMVAVPLAGIIGAPISGIILGMHGILGLAGWKLLFLIEGAPAVLLAFAVLAWLPNGPQDASWLEVEEREAIIASLAREPTSAHQDFWRALRDPRLWLLVLPYFGIVLALYGLGFWLPQIVKAMGYTNLQTGFLVALPYVLAAGAMILWGRHSDSRGERIAHFVLGALLAAAGFAGAALLPDSLSVFLALVVATVGVYACFGPFWSVPGGFLGATAAAGGIALINSLGNLGGFVGPSLVGWVKGTTDSYAAAMGLFTLAAVVSALAMALVGWIDERSRRAALSV